MSKKKSKVIGFSLLALAAMAASSAAQAELCTVGRNTEVLWKGEWYKARVTEASPDKCKITYAGYTKDDDEIVPLGRIQIR